MQLNLLNLMIQIMQIFMVHIYMNKYVSAVKDAFSGTTNRNIINLVSQISFSRLNPMMVNILLKKKPDGTDNIVDVSVSVSGLTDGVLVYTGTSW